MRTGIMLPNGIPDRPGTAIATWARRAERHGFDSIGVIDRLVYDSVDPLVALAAAAAVTEHIDLVTDVLITPWRNTIQLAKQAASVDLVSNGRLTLGVGSGIRVDDFELGGGSYRQRGQVFDAQLAELREAWRSDAIGPAPSRSGGPHLLIGGAPELAASRIARHGAGWTMAIGSPAQFADGLQRVNRAWQDAGRDGTPRTMALLYAAIGPDAAELVEAAVGGYYAWLGPELVEGVLSTCAVGNDALTERIDEFAVAGVDELMITPCSADLDQLDLLADIALASSFGTSPTITSGVLS